MRAKTPAISQSWQTFGLLFFFSFLGAYLGCLSFFSVSNVDDQPAAPFNDPLYIPATMTDPMPEPKFSDFTTTEQDIGIEDLTDWYTYPPAICDNFYVKNFPSVIEIGHRGITGEEGGDWTPCTGLMLYGFSYHSSLGNFLAYVLKPKTVLEFGCGFGQQSDYLARFVPGGADVTCIEPQPMFKEIFQSRQPPHRAKQLAINVFKPEAKECVDELKLFKRDLVVTTEVAEHIPAEFREQIVDLLGKITGKYLVFSAGRPGQGGHGHLEESQIPKEEWISLFEAYGLRHSPRYTFLAKQSVTGQREYDIKGNLFVMLAPGVPDLGDDEYPEGHDIVDFDKAFTEKNSFNEPDTTTEKYKKLKKWRTDALDQGYASWLLWPEFETIVKQMKRDGVCEKKTD